MTIYVSQEGAEHNTCIHCKQSIWRKPEGTETERRWWHRDTGQMQCVLTTVAEPEHLWTNQPDPDCDTCEGNGIYMDKPSGYPRACQCMRIA